MSSAIEKIKKDKVIVFSGERMDKNAQFMNNFPPRKIKARQTLTLWFKDIKTDDCLGWLPQRPLEGNEENGTIPFGAELSYLRTYLWGTPRQEYHQYGFEENVFDFTREELESGELFEKL